jgi:hypothetical protein
MGLTRKQLFKGINSCGSRYIAFRTDNGILRAANVMVANLGPRIRGFEIDDEITSIAGFYPISFAEYIRLKTPYERL